MPERARLGIRFSKKRLAASNVAVPASREYYEMGIPSLKAFREGVRGAAMDKDQE